MPIIISNVAEVKSLNLEFSVCKMPIIIKIIGQNVLNKYG